jgi:hypothetical protein
MLRNKIKTYHAAASELRYYREQMAHLNAYRVRPMKAEAGTHRSTSLPVRWSQYLFIDEWQIDLFNVQCGIHDEW